MKDHTQYGLGAFCQPICSHSAIFHKFNFKSDAVSACWIMIKKLKTTNRLSTNY